MPVNVPGQFLSNIRISGGLRTIGQHTRVVQRINPHLPVFAAHDCHRIVYFVLSGLLQMKILHLLFVGIDALLHRITADRLQRGVVHHAGNRVLSAWRCQTVDHQINLPHIGFDRVDSLLLDCIAEGIAIDTFSIQASGLRMVVEGRRVVPSGRPRFGLCTLFLKEDSECIGTTTERRCDTG